MSGGPPPPPPPPHGENPKTTRSGGLPPGKYDVFIIPEHSAGAGFLYLPSLRPNTNSFVAGFASAIVLVVLLQSMAPAFRLWWSNFQGMGSMGMMMLTFAVGLGAWSLGRTQQSGDGGSGGQGHSRHNSHSGPGGGAFGNGGTHGGFGDSSAPPPPPPPPPHNDPPPNQNGGPHQSPPPPGPETPRQEKPKQSWQQRPPEPEPQPQQQQHQSSPKPEHKPETKPDPKSAWERAREETRKKEEERKKKEEDEKKREAIAARLKALREREARERAQREKEKNEREAKEKAEREAKERELREALEKKEKELNELREREQKERELRELRAREMAERLAKERLEKEKADKEKLEKEKLEKEKKEKEAQEARKGTAYAYSGGGEKLNPWPNGKPAVPSHTTPSPQSSAPRSTPSVSTPPPQPATPTAKPPAPTARTYVDEDETYSYRPYDKPKRSQHRKSNSEYSESSWAPSQSTARTTPPPSMRMPYSTKDPDKIVIRAVYGFLNQFAKTPGSQLISGQAPVTDGLILRITTEGLFIDDDVRGVPQREWDVKAWTLKQVEVWCPAHLAILAAREEEGPNTLKKNQQAGGSSFLRGVMGGAAAGRRGAPKTLLGEEADAYLNEMLRVCKDKCGRGLAPDAGGGGQLKGLHVLRATIRDQEGKRYLFVVGEEESWKLAIGLQKLRKGAQARALGVLGMSNLERRNTLEMLGWTA